MSIRDDVHLLMPRVKLITQKAAKSIIGVARSPNEPLSYLFRTRRQSFQWYMPKHEYTVIPLKYTHNLITNIST